MPLLLAMESAVQSWPSCASEWQDVLKFCNMLTGKSRSAKIVDLSDRVSELWTRAKFNGELPNSEEECMSHLFQIEDCDDVLSGLPELLQKVFDMKVRKEREVNVCHPQKAIEIRKGQSKVYYHSSVINGNECNCPITFGGEAWKETQETVVRAAVNTIEGINLQTWLDENLLTDKSWYKSAKSLLVEYLFFDLCFQFSQVGSRRDDTVLFVPGFLNIEIS